jgi:hypothetical protein
MLPLSEGAERQPGDELALHQNISTGGEAALVVNQFPVEARDTEDRPCCE